ncbi:MAG: PEGA domain-containing protein [Sandaracinaceae bacterium]|nr:PEGA domain-containing protein [Sandaracinaceae bacterium]
MPRFSPDRGLHRPEVLELVARVGGALPGAIVVESSPDDPPNCTVRVNGVRVGQSPGARVAVPAGTYAVQLECRSEPGRVHRVQVGTGDVSVRVRASLDAALVSRPVSLVYGSSSALSSLPGDVAELGRAVGADRVLAVVEGPSGVALRAFAVSDSGPARQLRESTLAPGSDDARIRASVAALASSQLGNPAGSRRADTTESIPVYGPILLGIGGAALLAGGIVGGVALNEDAAFRTACPDLTACPPDTQPQFEAMRLLAGASDTLLVAGSITAIVGLILTLTLRESERGVAAAACGARGCALEISF